MLLKCNCSQCSGHLEFESDHLGTVITCPTCGRPTKLVLPEVAEGETDEPAGASSARGMRPAISAGSPKATLQAVRARTCYATLRSFINVFQIIFFVIAGLTAIAGVGEAIFMYRLTEGAPTNLFSIILVLTYLVVGLVMATLLVLFGIAVKQAMLVVVDIADCQIQQISRG
jgi:hypothetical protein